MKDAYLELKKKREHYTRYAVKGEFDEIPEEEELSRAKEEAADLERAYSVMYSGHSGKPGSDCPF